MKFFALRLLLFVILTMSAPSATFAHTIAGEVVAVADGDTITVRVSAPHHKIRLNGIDAPESAQIFGQESKQNLSDLLFGEQVVVIWSKTARYGWILGTVTIGSVDASLHQVKTGFAWYFHRYESDMPEIERHLYAAAEADAKANKLGLWSQAHPIAPWDWRGLQESPSTNRPTTSPPPAPPAGGVAPASAGTTRRTYSI
jgi:endonuclease YncB( thermonuclease family)